MTSVTSSEARATLPEILDRVLSGEEVTITRHGRPVAVVVRPDALRVRRADEVVAAADRLRDSLLESRRRPLPRDSALTGRRADELVAAARQSRHRA